MRYWFLLLFVVALSACGQTQQELAGSSWLLQSYGAATAQQSVLPNTSITLVIDESGKRAGGSGGCNSYGGDLTVQGNTLTIQNIVSTLIACTDPGVAEQEAAYLELLQRVSDFAKTDTTLTLIAAEDRLEFTSQ